MVGCQGQLEKLNFLCAAMHSRIYSLAGWSKAFYNYAPIKAPNRLDTQVVIYVSVKLICSSSEMLLFCIHQVFYKSTSQHYYNRVHALK